MTDTSQTSIRFAPAELAIIDQIQERTGVRGMAAAVRFALLYWARVEGVEVKQPKRKRPKR